MRIETRQNFVSVDSKTARNSHGDFFTVGETVRHQEDLAGNATIQKFEADLDKNEIRVDTDKGYAYLDFLEKDDMTTTNHRATAHTPADYDAAITAIMRSDAISGRAYEAALTAIRLAREEALNSH